MTNEELVSLAKAGDTAAYNLLFEQNKGFAYYVADKWKNTRLERDDLVSICFLGMLKAYRGFDVAKGIKFLTFANMCMNNEIKMAISRKKLNIVHMDGIRNNKKDGTEEDTWEMPYIEDRFAHIENLSMFQDVLTTVSKKYNPSKMLVLQEIILGDSDQPTVAHKLGVGQPFVSRMVKMIRADIHKVAKYRGCVS